MKQLKVVGSIIVTLIFLVYIFLKMDWSSLFLILDEINFIWFTAASLIYFICYILRSIRVKILIENPKVSFSQLLCVNILHYFFNRIYPARLGDFSLIYLLKKELNVKTISGTNIFVFIKLYDLLVSILLLAISYSTLYKFNILTFWMWVTFSVVFLFSLKPSVLTGLLSRILSRITNGSSRWKIVKKVNIELESLINQSKKCESNDLRMYLFVLSLAIWILLFLFFYLLFLSIGKYFGLWDTLFATTLSNFSWILPINGVGGFGTMEVSMAYAFSLRGFSFSNVLIYALYINVTILVLSTLFAIVPYFKIFGKRIVSETNHSNTMP